MRLPVLAVLAVTLPPTAAIASPYDVSWSTFNFGLGGPAASSGELGDRLDGTPCRDGTCELGSRFVVGGGVGRWGVEVHLAASPMTDEIATDYRDRDRLAIRFGPMVRFTAIRKWGFDASLRGGVHYGRVSGTTTTTTAPDTSCPIGREGNCPPITIDYEPPGYGMWALSIGATAMWRVRIEGRGFVGVYVDLDYLAGRVEFDDDSRIGAIASRTYGVAFGTMLDIDAR